VLASSCDNKAIVRKTKQLTKDYNKHINNNRKNRPTLIDKYIFKKTRSKLTHYAIDKTIVE
jgi:hypothetical protein